MCVLRTIAFLLALASIATGQRRQFELDPPAAFGPHSFQRMVTVDVDGDGDVDAVVQGPGNGIDVVVENQGARSPG